MKFGFVIESLLWLSGYSSAAGERFLLFPPPPCSCMTGHKAKKVKRKEEVLGVMMMFLVVMLELSVGLLVVTGAMFLAVLGVQCLELVMLVDSLLMLSTAGEEVLGGEG